MKRLLYGMLLLACAVVTITQAGKSRPQRKRAVQAPVVRSMAPVQQASFQAPLQKPIQVPQQTADLSPAQAIGIPPSVSGFDFFSSEPGANVTSSPYGVEGAKAVSPALVSTLSDETDPEARASVAQSGELLPQTMRTFGDKPSLGKNFIQRNKKKLLAVVAAVAAMGYAGHYAYDKKGGREFLNKLRSSTQTQAAAKEENKVPLEDGELSLIKVQGITGKRFLELTPECQKQVINSFDSSYFKESRSLFLKFVSNLIEELKSKNTKALLNEGKLPLRLVIVKGLLNKIGQDKYLLGGDFRAGLRRDLKIALGLTKEEAHKYFINLPGETNHQVYFLKKIDYFVYDFKKVKHDSYYAFVKNILRTVSPSDVKDVLKYIKTKEAFEELKEGLADRSEELLKPYEAVYNDLTLTLSDPSVLDDDISTKTPPGKNEPQKTTNNETQAKVEKSGSSGAKLEDSAKAGSVRTSTSTTPTTSTAPTTTPANENALTIQNNTTAASQQTPVTKVPDNQKVLADGSSARSDHVNGSPAELIIKLRSKGPAMPWLLPKRHFKENSKNNISKGSKGDEGQLKKQEQPNSSLETPSPGSAILPATLPVGNSNLFPDKPIIGEDIISSTFGEVLTDKNYVRSQGTASPSTSPAGTLNTDKTKGETPSPTTAKPVKKEVVTGTEEALSLPLPVKVAPTKEQRKPLAQQAPNNSQTTKASTDLAPAIQQVPATNESTDQVSQSASANEKSPNVDTNETMNNSIQSASALPSLQEPDTSTAKPVVALPGSGSPNVDTNKTMNNPIQSAGALPSPQKPAPPLPSKDKPRPTREQIKALTDKRTINKKGSGAGTLTNSTQVPDNSIKPENLEGAGVVAQTTAIQKVPAPHDTPENPN